MVDGKAICNNGRWYPLDDLKKVSEIELENERLAKQLKDARQELATQRAQYRALEVEMQQQETYLVYKVDVNRIFEDSLDPFAYSGQGRNREARYEVKIETPSQELIDKILEMVE